MNFLRSIFLVLAAIAIVIAVVGGMGGLPASAFEDGFTPQPVEDLIKLAAALLASLVGIPAFLSALLTLLETLNKIDAGQSDVIQIWANIILYLGAFFAVLFGKTDLLSAIDHYLGGFAPVLLAFIAFLTGAIKSIVQTRSYQESIRLLYPVRLRATHRLNMHRVIKS